MSDPAWPAWLRGDVPGIVADMNEHWEKHERPFPTIGKSHAQHARSQALHMIDALARSDIRDDHETRGLILAVLDAVDAIVEAQEHRTEGAHKR